MFSWLITFQSMAMPSSLKKIPVIGHGTGTITATPAALAVVRHRCYSPASLTFSVGNNPVKGIGKRSYGTIRCSGTFHYLLYFCTIISWIKAVYFPSPCGNNIHERPIWLIVSTFFYRCLELPELFIVFDVDSNSTSTFSHVQLNLISTCSQEAIANVASELSVPQKFSLPLIFLCYCLGIL